MPTSKVKRNPRADLTRKVLEQMKTHGPNWVKPWAGQIANGAHHNCVTGNVYTGGNVFLLWIAAEKNGFTDTRWSTYKGWESTDTPVPKGEKATAYVLTPMPTKLKDAKGKPVLDKNGDQKTGLFFRAVALWNAEQVGLEPEVSEGKERTQIERFEDIERFIANTGADIRVKPGSPHAYYKPIADYIVMPAPEDFIGDTPEEKLVKYYGTLFHEEGHWTGNKSRLNRPEIYERSTENYAFEELTAELTAIFMTADLGIEHTPAPDHAQYLAGWIKALENDENLFFKAAGKAQKAAAFLHGLQPNTNDAAEKAA